MDSGRRHRGVPLGIVFLIVGLVIGDVRATEEVCRTGCKGTAKTFKYATGTTYKYNYDGKIEISLSSAKGQTTSTEVKAEVLLTQGSDCNQILKLQNVQLLGTNGKKVGAIPDIDKPIRINFNDGEVSDSICVVDGDNQNSINIKRAIASLFQASAKSGYETDVFGRCPTEVTSQREGQVLVLKKARNLNRCGYREHIQQPFISTAFNLNSEVKSSPLLDGDYRAVLKIKNGIVDQATVTEEYAFVPFSVGQNGAKAQVTSKLQYVGTGNGNEQAAVTQPRSIIFENPHPIAAPGSNVQAIINAVKEIVKSVDSVVSQSTAKQFVNLIKVVRVSQPADILAAYNQIKSGVAGDVAIAKRAFLDSLLESGNGETIQAILELLKRNELDEFDTRLNLIGLSAARHATEGALTAAVQLLDNTKYPRETYLGVGNLAGIFCRQHSCEKNAAVKTLLDKIVSKISNKATDRHQEDEIIYALKALGNVGYLNDNLLVKLTGIAQAKNLPTRLRIAALDAYLANPCKNKLRDSALTILQDIQQDSEIRIKAYLAVAACPNAKAGNTIKALIEKEPSIQVGGFIVSHLRSIQTSTNPDKHLAAQFLSFTPQKRFPYDPRRYSFNSEVSYAADSAGIAASNEANVIYSQNSWLPRSTSLNLTAQVFGHTFNFLEIDTRQENLEKLVEHYFGPKGVLRTRTDKEWSKGAGEINKIKEYVSNKVEQELKRAKRDVSKAELDNIGKQVQIKTNELNKDLDLDLTIKAFGAELLFLNLNQEATSLTPEAIIDKLFAKVGDSLDKLRNFQEVFRRNILFIDTDIAYPTSLGFPLRLAAEGSASLQVQAQGSLNVRKLITNSLSGQASLKLVPSASIEVSGRLTLDALLVENGLKVVSTLHTATGGEAALSWDNTGGFEIKYGFPVQEQKVISAEHEIVFHNREQGGSEHNLPLKFEQPRDFSICLDQLSPFIGLTLCVELNGPTIDNQQVPSIGLPLAGDAKLAVTIENEEVSAFVIRHTVQGPRGAHAELLFETIGKNNARKAAFNLIAEYSPETYLKAVLTSPVKNAEAELRVIITNVEKSLSAKFVDDQQVHSAKIGIAISGSAQRTAFEPILQFKTPQGEQVLPLQVGGRIIVEQNQNEVKYIFDQLKLVVQNSQLSVTGNAGSEANGILYSDVTISDGKDSVTITGRLQLSPELINLNANVKNTVNPKANFNLKSEFSKKPDEYHSSVILVHGPDLNSKTSVLTLTGVFINRFVSSKDYTFELKNSISYPLLELAGKFEVEETPKSGELKASVQYGPVKFGSEFEIEVDQKNQGDYDLEFDLWGLENKLEIKSKREVLGEDESKISNTVEVNGRKVEVNGKVKHLIRPHNLDVGTDLTITIDGHTSPLKLSNGLTINQGALDLHQKLTSGNEALIDLFLKANTNWDANGSVKVNFKNFVTVNGKIHSNKGKGSGDILIVDNGKHEIKSETTFTIVPSQQLDYTLTIYPAFNTDKNSKIFLSTKNKYSQTSWDSQNKLDLLGNPFELNLKGVAVDDGTNSKVSTDIDFTILNDKYLALSSLVNNQKNGNLYNGNDQYSIEYRPNKNAAGNKLSYKGTWKNVDLEELFGTFDSTFSFDSATGKNVNLDVFVQGQKNLLSSKTKLHGNALTVPYELSANIQGDEEAFQYQISGSAGPQNTLNVKGDLDNRGDEKLSGSINVQASSSSKLLRTVNIALQGALVAPSTHSTEPLKVDSSFIIFADDDGTNPGPIIDIKSNENLVLGDESGSVKGTLALTSIEPVSYDASYQVSKNGVVGAASINYGAGKTLKGEGSFTRVTELNDRIEVTLTTPFEIYKNVKWVYDVKRSKDKEQISVVEDVVIDGQAYKLEGNFVGGDLEPLIDIKYTHPNGQKDLLYAKGNIVSDKQFGVDFKADIKYFQFDIDGNLNVNIETVENFLIKGQVNSVKLELNKITFEAQNKPNNKDRKIHVLIKSAGKNLVSGTTSYTSKEENGKYIIEGSGTFKVKEESKSGNFKYITQNLETAKNGEEGIQISFDAVLGHWALDSEYKFSNKNFRFQSSYCEQKKDCASVEVDAKLNTIDENNFNSVTEVNIDLRKLGLSHEFGLKSVADRKGWVVDHTVEVHFQSQETNKYIYHYYIQPQKGGLTFTTPKRIIALEGNSKVDQKSGEYARGTGDLGFYLDKKNHPDKRTALTWNFDANVRGVVSGDVKFTHPGLRKPLAASVKSTRTGTPYKGKLDIVSEFDVFAQENQKIVATFVREAAFDETNHKGSGTLSARFQSKGLGFDISASETISGDQKAGLLTYDGKVTHHFGKANYENAYSLKISPNEYSGLIKVLNKDLIKYLIRVQAEQKQYTVDFEGSSYDNNPVASRLVLKNYNTLDYSIGFRKTPNTKITVNAGLIPGQIADLRADYIQEGNKKSLFYATVKLDDANFLKSDYNADSKAVEAAIQRVKGLTDNYVNGVETLAKEWAEETKTEAQSIAELIKKAQPNLGPLRQYYTKELQELKQEILSDKNLKELSEAVTQVLAAVISAISDLIDKLSQITESAVQALQGTFSGVIDVLEKQLIPQLKELSEQALTVAKSVLGTLSDIAFAVVGKFAEIIERYQPDLKAFSITLGSVWKDVSATLGKTFFAAEDVLRIFIDSEIASELKVQYQKFIKDGLPNADAVIGTIREVLHTLTEAIPPEFALKEDITKLVEALVNYLEKKLKSQSVDDAAVFREIGERLTSIVDKVISSPVLLEYKPSRPEVKEGWLPKGLVGGLPRLALARFSGLNYLASPYFEKDIDDLENLLRNPLFIPPFPLLGLVVQGQHIFTFDGELLTVPGSCNYLLARDALNGNFSIAGSYKDGQLVSITIADKTDTLTLLKTGQAKVGTSTQDLPVRRPTLAVYRNYEIITLLSTAGAKVDCVPDLSGCAVTISGFYHGQIKGLLGNGNSEPYDDYALPSGKLVTSTTEFANAYKLNSGCADVTVPSDAVPENSICNKLFSTESSLSPAYPVLPVDNFKTACARGLAAGIKDTEEIIAKAYVASSIDRGVFIKVPKTLLKCTNSDKEYSVGDTFSVKLPSKSADVVLVLDTEKANEILYKQLLVPLVQDLNKEFHGKGINDVEYHLITYGGLNQWPTHVTSQGKLTFKGKVPQVKFGEGPKDEFNIDEIKDKDVQFYVKFLQEFFHDLGLATGSNLKTQTFDEAYKYPFRVNALKSIIIVNSEACKIGQFYPIQKLFAAIYKNEQISVNLFTPVKTLELRNSQKQKDVVGFNSHSVLTLSQAKKNPRGSAELHKDLAYDDYCLEYVVNNRGNVFVNDNFLANKASQKQFVQIAAVNIVDQLINVEQGLNCECKRVNPWNAANVCTEAFTSARTSKKV